MGTILLTTPLLPCLPAILSPGINLQFEEMLHLLFPTHEEPPASPTLKGEVIADDVVINGRIVGRVRGLKVRLTATARVEGDIIHKTIAIESGAHFEGSVQRQDDPLTKAAAAKPAAAAPAPRQTCSNISTRFAKSRYDIQGWAFPHIICFWLK